MERRNAQTAFRFLPRSRELLGIVPKGKCVSNTNFRDFDARRWELGVHRVMMFQCANYSRLGFAFGFKFRCLVASRLGMVPLERGSLQEWFGEFV